MEIDENLKKLISDWAFREGREASATSFLPHPHLPASLLDRITAREPFRARAIDDAKILWAMPFAPGFGMELFFPETISIEPFRNWSETVRDLTAQMEYSERMDADDRSGYEVRLERVGREAGEWRIIEIFSHSERTRMSEISEKMREFFAEPENQN
jgi:hypothetical protein